MGGGGGVHLLQRRGQVRIAEQIAYERRTARSGVRFFEARLLHQMGIDEAVGSHDTQGKAIARQLDGGGQQLQNWESQSVTSEEVQRNKLQTNSSRRLPQQSPCCRTSRAARPILRRSQAL